MRDRSCYLTTAAVAILVSGVMATALHAEERPAAGEPADALTLSEDSAPSEAVAPPAKHAQTTGAVTSVDAERGLLTVSSSAAGHAGAASQAQSLTVLVQEDTVLTYGTDPIGLASLHKGDWVTVDYSQQGEQVIAHVVQQQPPPPSEPTIPAAPAKKKRGSR